MLLGRTGWTGVVLLLAWLGGTFGALAAPNAASEAEKLNQLRTRIDKLQKDLSRSEESRGEATDALKTSETAISEVNRALAVLARDQSRIGRDLTTVQQRINTTRADVVRQQDLLDRVVRHQYMHGNADALRLVLEGEDVARVERQVTYLGYISRARVGLIARLRHSLTQLAELEAAAREQKQALATNAAEQKQVRTKLEGERRERRALLVRLSSDITRNRREIGRLKRDQDRLTRLVEELAKAIAPQRPRAETPGRVVRPGERVDEVADAGFVGKAFESLRGKLKLPTKGEITSRFGAPREEGGVTWKGLFIRAQQGVAVHAVADGRVIFADWMRGFGNLLVLDHGNGYMSLYGNNDSLLRQVGEAVPSGETVALVGSTGGAAESGVYFELRHEAKAFDPLKWVAR